MFRSNPSGFGWIFVGTLRARQQYQPTRTEHDPNPPITLENADAPASTFVPSRNIALLGALLAAWAPDLTPRNASKVAAVLASPPPPVVESVPSGRPAATVAAAVAAWTPESSPQPAARRIVERHEVPGGRPRLDTVLATWDVAPPAQARPAGAPSTPRVPKGRGTPDVWASWETPAVVVVSLSRRAGVPATPSVPFTRPWGDLVVSAWADAQPSPRRGVAAVAAISFSADPPFAGTRAALLACSTTSAWSEPPPALDTAPPIAATGRWRVRDYTLGRFKRGLGSRHKIRLSSPPWWIG